MRLFIDSSIRRRRTRRVRTGTAEAGRQVVKVAREGQGVQAGVWRGRQTMS